MTALTQYQRLEAPGVWRADQDSQRLNVIVSVGDATLTLTDMSDLPRAHWSLAAVRRLNPGERPALYAPSSDPNEPETLEIGEPEMIDAIETVRRAVERSRPRFGRLRLFSSLALAAGLAAAAIFWGPGALVRQTASVLPGVTRESVGERLFARLGRVTGSPCANEAGTAALDRLRLRLLGPDRPGRIAVVTSGVGWARHLPGGMILLDRGVVEDYEAPDVAAGFILTEAVRADEVDPMLALLAHAGPFATARLLATGTLSDRVLDSYAEEILTEPPVAVPPDTLLARFADAHIASTPYAFAIDQTGETTLALIEADPAHRQGADPLLDEDGWADLQKICED